MLAPRRGLPLLFVLALTGCSQAGSPTPVGSPPPGIVVVTTGGVALDDGAADVPPTLDLAVSGDGVNTSVVGGKLDGRSLSLSDGDGGVVARVAPMAYASKHTLDLDVAGRRQEVIDFHVVDRTQVSAAVWLGASRQPVVDVVFEHAPDQAPVAAALPGAKLTWTDSTHLLVGWSTPPASISIPAGLPAAMGSVLEGPLHLSLTGLGSGQLRRATVPPAIPAPPGVHVMLWTVGTAASHASTVAHAAATTILSPTGWVAESDGSLSDSPDAVTLAAAAAEGRPAWPLLANDFSDPGGTTQLLSSSAAEASLIGTLMGEVSSLHLGGIDLDFEDLPGTDRDAFTAFAGTLASALHSAGAGLAIDVIPNAPGVVDALASVYNYPQLAAVADLLVVMAYDEHTAAGDPGPVAGVGWQAEELAGTLQGVPASKVLLGIPFYSRRWSGGDVTASDYADSVAQALSEPDVSYDYDFGGATPILDSDPGGVATQLYFDDADSLLRKIDLAASLGLEGVAAWRSGFEDPAFWSVV
jgi:spore germination protein YaaH